jgi:hypothetical protein
LSTQATTWLLVTTWLPLPTNTPEPVPLTPAALLQIIRTVLAFIPSMGGEAKTACTENIVNKKVFIIIK